MMKNMADARGHTLDTQMNSYSSTNYNNKAEESEDDDE